MFSHVLFTLTALLAFITTSFSAGPVLFPASHWDLPCPGQDLSPGNLSWAYSEACLGSLSPFDILSTGLPTALNVPAPPFSLPSGSATDRAAQLEVIRDSFVYGPDIASSTSDGPYFPEGAFADKIIAEMNASFYSAHGERRDIVKEEAMNLAKKRLICTFWDAKIRQWVPSFKNHFCRQSLDSLAGLYDSWDATLPGGVFPGILENATSDLGFAMERLSFQPYAARRFSPAVELSFTVDNGTARSLSTMTMAELHQAGRLFYVDYREQASQVLTKGRYAAACDAYFFLHPVSGDFLPLAIRLNAGSLLVYTPLDGDKDWTLAKMAFNLNDFWYGQWYHLVATHEVIDLVFTSAVRSLSTQHPLYALLARIAHQTFVFRQVAMGELLHKGGPVDKIFAWSGAAAANYSAHLYQKEANRWQANYLATHLERRGLVNSPAGPPLTSFPFATDASAIVKSFRKYMIAFVKSYYASDAALAEDDELQAWLAEAAVARVVDFPSDLSTREALADVLTHAAYLVSVLHGTINGNSPAHGSAVLPMHPGALYAPLPTAKGITDLSGFLPPLTTALRQIALLGNFNRPFLAGTEWALAGMFDGSALNARSNKQVRAAARLFRNEMRALSARTQARDFDQRGRSMGMPFVWQALDPLVAMGCLAI